MFSDPVSFYLTSLARIGQVDIARTLRGIARAADAQARRSAFLHGREDDWIRTVWKRVDLWAAERTPEQPACAMLIGLHNLGAKKAYDKEAVIEDVRSWVTGPDSFPVTQDVLDDLDDIFTSWRRDSDDSKYLSFEEFVQDPVRWGTGGGAPRSTVDGTQYRTKWAWAFSRLIEGAQWVGGDLYKEALALDARGAIVALKEEPTKTRAIITSPLGSYLRQSYLLYRIGKPSYNAPFANPDWLPRFQAQTYAWYGATDGKGFDHTVSADFVIANLERLGRTSPECARIAAEEIEHIRTLKVVLPFGKGTLKYEKGVLSGWRLTTVLDTNASICAAKFMLRRLRMEGGVTCGAQGDDLVMASDSHVISAHDLAEEYEAFGLHANRARTTSGAAAEFLRRMYTVAGIIAYPALSVRSIFYAPPWLSDFDSADPVLVSSRVLTLLSRVLPFRTSDTCIPWFINFAVAELHRWNPRLSKADYRKLVLTPIAAGGCGCLEVRAGPGDWVGVAYPVERTERFLSLFGMQKQAPPAEVKKLLGVRKFAWNGVLSAVKAIEHGGDEYFDVRLPTNINLTRTIHAWFFDDTASATSITHLLGVRLPRHLRAAGKYEIAQYIMGQEKRPGGSSSIQVTGECDGRASRYLKRRTAAALNARGAFKLRNFKAASVIFGLSHLTNIELPRGTW